MSSPHGQEEDAPLWAVSAEFATPGALLAAVRAVHALPHARIDTYSPVPVPGVTEALGVRGGSMRRYAVSGGALGGVLMMGMCLYATGYDYVFDIGGRPRFSWPAYMVPTMSFAVLMAASAVVLLLLILNRLPTLNHPSFNIPGFDRASQDRFFVAVESRGHGFDPAEAERRLARLATRPIAVHRVPR